MFIGISGHRDYKDRKNIRKWMVGIKKKYPDAVIVTGGALGADLIASEEALAVGLKSRVILPMKFKVFTGRWSEDNKYKLINVLERSEVDILSDGDKYEVELLMERNQAIVDEVSILVAFWDGRRYGGTFDCVKRAYQDDYVRIFNGISWREIERDSTLSSRFQTEEACIEGLQALQERIGRTEYAFYNESADFEYISGAVFERHEVVGDFEPEVAVAARVWGSTRCEKELAKEIAWRLEEVGYEYESYFRQWLKQDFQAAFAELKRLSDGLADLMPNPLDAMNHSWVQSWNDDPYEDTEEVYCDPTYGWHKVPSRDWIDPALPLPPEAEKYSAGAFALCKRISACRKSSELRFIGRILYRRQKENIDALSLDDWSLIWSEYRFHKKWLGA
ncbi:MAG: SLOG family protein [Candidatus Poribacteria bacterium]